MRSVCSRFNDASTCFSICARARPSSPAKAIPTLVAITTRSRLPPCFSHSPMIASDSPPVWPGTQVEYVLAVSIVLKPASTKRSRMANEVALSAVQPKTLPPRTIGAVARPERPRGRICMGFSG
jgi:hypothetical protein